MDNNPTKGGIQLPKYTENYSLEKPLATEKYDIKVQNGNMDRIDTAIDAVDEKVETLNG